MKILIIGAGKVGLAITKQLMDEGHDITVMDIDADKVGHISDMYDVISIVGSGTNFDTLKEAGVKSSNLVICATGSDEDNLVIGAAAKYLGAGQTIARLKNIFYTKQNEILNKGFGIGASFTPDMEAAKEIARIVQFPFAARVETFAGGRAEMVEYRVPEESRLCGTALKKLGELSKAKVLICAVERDGTVSIPNGEYVLKAGDRINVAGIRANIRNFFSDVNANKHTVHDVMIFGGSRIALFLAKQLCDSGYGVTILDREMARCEEMCAILPKANIVCGDGCQQEVLQEEGIGHADAFVALTGDDEDNIIVSMYAQHSGVGKVITKISDDHFTQLLGKSGLDCFICPKILAASEIVRYVRAMGNAFDSSSVETLYRLIDDKVEALEFIVGKNSGCVGTPLKNLKLKPNILIAAVIHENEFIYPDGETVIYPNDHAVIVTTRTLLQNLDDILEQE